MLLMAAVFTYKTFVDVFDCACQLCRVAMQATNARWQRKDE